MDAVKAEIVKFCKDGDKNLADLQFVKVKDDKHIAMSFAGEIDFVIVVEGPKKFVQCNFFLTRN
ncbi:hypothetical protein OFN20_29890, partial [Escherichia coli]|nr:hypothetical protein [Escherichia coli]